METELTESRVQTGEKQKKDAGQYSPLVLAYMGDAVFEIFVREKLVREANMPVNKLHRAASALVNATSQSLMIAALEEALTPEERNIFRRGRNAKSNTAAKHAAIADYRRATGFEALLGWLYLQGKQERLKELMEMAVQAAGGIDRHE